MQDGRNSKRKLLVIWEEATPRGTRGEEGDNMEEEVGVWCWGRCECHRDTELEKNEYRVDSRRKLMENQRPDLGWSAIGWR